MKENMFAIEVTTHFSASHRLRLPDGSLEPLHGHNWQVTVKVISPVLDALETVMDFHILDERLQEIIAPWHNHHLNDFPPFDQRINPSAERVAERIAGLLAPSVIGPATLAEVRITEAPGCTAIYQP